MINDATEDSFKEELNNHARKNHALFAALVGIVLPIWSIFDYFIVHNLFWELFYIRLISSIFLGFLSYLAFRRIIGPILLGYAIIFVLYDLLGILMILLDESQLRYWSLSYSTCFLAVALFETWEFRHHLINMAFTWIVVPLAIHFFGKVYLLTAFIDGLIISFSVAVGCSGLFILRIRWMKENYILMKKLEASIFDLYNKNKKISDQMDQLRILEAEVVQKEKMATIGLLASGVAHQLGNTINSILTSAIDIDRAAKKNKLSPEFLSSEVGSINTAAKISTEIIRGLDYATKRNVENEMLNLNEVVNVSIILMKGLLLERVRTFNEVEKDARALGSKSGLLQVFMNLISNSNDAMSSGDIVISSSRRGDFQHITYKDSGPGIPEDLAPRIFEAFFTTKKADKGTGLGLYVVKQELEKMGSTIELLKSEKGATFLIKIPVGA